MQTLTALWWKILNGTERYVTKVGYKTVSSKTMISFFSPTEHSLSEASWLPSSHFKVSELATRFTIETAF